MLMDALEEVTKLATQTHLNADYVPGILSVLHREELLALGMRTVGEALTLVPGIQVNRGDFGESRISIRGMEHGNGDIKMLLDSIPLNHGYDGKAMIAPIPIEHFVGDRLRRAEDPRYMDDYPIDDERLWWAQLSYEWK